MSPPVVVSIAGTDSGGAAGLAADLATFAALGVHGSCVVTAVTAQDTLGVRAIHRVPLEVVAAQLDAVLDDLDPSVVKTGMLGSAGVVRLVAERCRGRVVVVDPVLVATSGAILGDDAVVAAYREHLLPVATVCTPNRTEALALLGLATDDTMPPNRLAARLAGRLTGLGCAVVVTGGPEPAERHPAGSCTDWLCLPGDRPEPLTHSAVPTTHDHGTGCTFSSALAAELSETRGHKSGVAPSSTREPTPAEALRSACLRAADYTTTQLTTSSTWDLGRGRGPIAHTLAPWSRHGGSSLATGSTSEMA